MPAPDARSARGVAVAPRAHVLVLAHDESNEGGAHLFEVEDEVDGPGVDRGLGHAGELGRGRVLGDDRAAGLGDGLHPHVGVAARAGQHDPDRTPRVGPRRRLEEQVGGGADEVHQLRVRQVHAAGGGHEQVHVGWRHIGRRRLELDALGSLLDLERRAAAQDVRHQRAVAGVEMLHDDHRDREVGGQVAQDPAQGGEAAGRGGDHDDVESAVGRVPTVGIVRDGLSRHRDPLFPLSPGSPLSNPGLSSLAGGIVSHTMRPGRCSTDRRMASQGSEAVAA